MNAPRTVFSVCGMCEARCPVEVELKDDRPRWICGNTRALGGALCPRGAAGLALLADDERPQQPLIRTGERGEGRWREVDWDEALDYVADKLRCVLAAHGGKSLLWSERSGPYSDLNKAFVRGLGSPNYCTHEATCAHNVDQAAFSLCGADHHGFLYDYRRCRHLVLQNRNIFEAIDVREVNSVLDARDAGCRLTVIDVRASITACKADAFLQVRPGTDYALNLAVIHTLLREQWYDAADVAARMEDFDALVRFVEPYTPQWAATECGLPVESITSLARQLHEAAPAVIWHPGLMTSRYAQSFLVCRTAYIINALLGAVDNPGGLPRLAVPSPLVSLESLYPAPDERRADGVGWKFPCFAPGSSLLQNALAAVKTDDPYPVRAYVAFRHDPLSALPDPRTLRVWLKKLELLVSVTFSWSDTAWHADVVLPMSTYLERGSPLFFQSGLPPRLLMRRQVVPPVYNTRADWEITTGLARRMGLDKLDFTRIEDIWQRQLEGTGLTEEDFAATGYVDLPDAVLEKTDPFPTPSGRLEISPRVWREAGLDVLRRYTSPAVPPKGHFRLISGRVAQHTQGYTQNNVRLNGLMPENAAWIHPDRAAALNLRQGELATLRARDGTQALVRVRIAEGMHPEALFLAHGFGHKVPMETRAYGLGVADQEFMPGGLENVDAVSHCPALQEHFVILEKIQRDFMEDAPA